MAAAKKVLLIDDAPEHLLICKFVLGHRGYDVLTLHGPESLDELAETVYSFQPDIIFTDQDMPCINGEDVVRMIKQTPPFKHIPVIYFSGTEDLEELSQATGADDWLPKPLKVAAFLDILTKYTERGD